MFIFTLLFIVSCRYYFMGEILQIQIGHTGNRIGNSFWQQLMKEHNLDNYGKVSKSNSEEGENISNFFEQQSDKTYRARTIFADTEPSSLENIMKSPMINVFPFQNFCFDNISTGNLWPVGYQKCPQLKSLLQQCIRREVERCDRFAGFHVIHSVSGGAGSGVSSLVQQIISPSFLKHITMNVTGLPSPKLSNIIVEPYNAILSLNKINEISGHPTVLFQNEALFRINRRIKAKTFRKDESPKSYDDINKVLATALANLTSTSRFPCDGNTGLRKISTNLIQFPARKFLIFNLPYIKQERQQNIKTLLKYKILNFHNLSISSLTNPSKKQKMGGVFFVFRGNYWGSFDINKKISQYMEWKCYYRYSRRLQYKKLYFVDELPHNYLANVVKSSPNKQQNSVTSLQNNSIVSDYMNQLYQKSFEMVRKRAFLHWYEREGIQLQEISEAQETILEIMNDYNIMVDQPECYEHEGYDE